MIDNMKISFFKAECGDAASIRYFGSDGKYHNIFIDSGYGRTFRFVLEDEIKEIIELGEIIDLWIISHVHDDHIGGILKYIETIKSGEYPDIVQQFFYNPPRKYRFDISADDISDASSIQQGDVLYEYLKSNNKLLDSDLVNTSIPIDLYGLKITLLSPSLEKLLALRKKYPVETNNEFEKEEEVSISEAVSGQNDYNKSFEDFDFKLWKEDSSIENGSSISFITEFENYRILWLADSHPSDILQALKRLGITKTLKIDCDLVKVSHHGSSGNNSQELYSLINCNNYIFSTNGENKHNLPSKECLAQILRVSNRDISIKYFFYFTYCNETLESIFSAESKEIFVKYNFETFFCDEKALNFNFH
jgi:beta-lactamase superfamily II metal-dependent hydrolase